MAELRRKQVGFVARDADETEHAVKVLAGHAPSLEASLDATPRRARETHIALVVLSSTDLPRRQEKARASSTQRQTSEKYDRPRRRR